MVEEKRSRYSEVMSHMEIFDVMLGSFPENDLDNEPENERFVDSVSAELQKNTEILRKDFKILLKSKGLGNSEVTIETIRKIKEKLKTRMSRKLEENRMELNSQMVKTNCELCNYGKKSSLNSKVVLGS